MGWGLFSLNSMSQSIIRNSRKELGVRNWSRGHRRSLLMACSGCFLRAPRTTSRGVTTPTVAWTLLHQSPFKNSTMVFCPQSDLVGALSHLRFPLPRGLYFLSSWHKTASTIDFMSALYANTSMSNQNLSCWPQDVTNINITIWNILNFKSHTSITNSSTLASKCPVSLKHPSLSKIPV